MLVPVAMLVLVLGLEDDGVWRDEASPVLKRRRGTRPGVVAVSGWRPLGGDELLSRMPAVLR